jgi:hydrogenase maturation protease
MQAAPVKPVLVFAWGNQSRGDDGLGPALFEQLEAGRLAGKLPGVDLLTDYQLQVEHALDLQGRERVLFVDASMTAAAPFEFSLLQPERDLSYTTHAMSPAAVLAVYQQVQQQPPPDSFLLSIRGYDFELGAPLSVRAEEHLQAAHSFVSALLAAPPDVDWLQQASASGYSPASVSSSI